MRSLETFLDLAQLPRDDCIQRIRLTRGEHILQIPFDALMQVGQHDAIHLEQITRILRG